VNNIYLRINEEVEYKKVMAGLLKWRFQAITCRMLGVNRKNQTKTQVLGLEIREQKYCK